MNLQENVNKSLMLSRVEQMHDFRGWAIKLPAFHFDKEWDVKIIPPFAGAIIRFVIDYNGKHVSVYFDAYSELGCMMKMSSQFHILNIMMVKILIDIILTNQSK